MNSQLKTEGFEAPDDDRQATGVVGGKRATGDQLLGQRSGGVWGRCARVTVVMVGPRLWLVTVVEAERELLVGRAAGSVIDNS
jgi:hypothetical protein